MIGSALALWQNTPTKDQSEPVDQVIVRFAADGKPTLYSRATLTASPPTLTVYTFPASVGGRYQVSVSINALQFWPPTLDELLAANPNATMAGITTFSFEFFPPFLIRATGFVKGPAVGYTNVSRTVIRVDADNYPESLYETRFVCCRYVRVATTGNEYFQEDVCHSTASPNSGPGADFVPASRYGDQCLVCCD